MTAIEVCMNGIHENVLSPARLMTLQQLGLLDTPAEEAFDRLGRLAAKILHTPVALVSLVEDTRQFFKSCIGLPEPWATWREMPLTYSICQHVVANSAPLVINDARLDPTFQNHPAIRDLGVVAYLGIPLRMRTGEVLGSFCVIDAKPRCWTWENEQMLETLAGCVMTEIELRNEIRFHRAATAEVNELNCELRRKAAALEAANKDLEAFNYSISHDLRSPLRLLNIFTGLLSECAGTHLTGECESHIEAIRVASQQMTSVIDGLLLLSRVSKGKLCQEPFDLSESARHIVSGLQQAYPERRVEIVIEPNMTVSGDRRLLQILLENLLGNAWKFTGKRAEARIEFGSILVKKARVFMVRDNGAGFDMEYANKLFVPFQRLHSEREFEGTGIGLGTVGRIIRRHQGRIWAEGRVNEGAAFYFTIPARD
ncbi:MAG: sensor signal transduction histidine kinase [Pedosphaera sp.]|nr:sensor signal transduction histidine kinase [Pedosphaera sp.]